MPCDDSIRPPNGPLSRFGKRFRKIVDHGTLSETAIGSWRPVQERVREMDIAEVLTAPQSQWQNVLLRDSSAPFGGNAWTTRSCQERSTYDGLCTTTLNITRSHALTCRWARTLHPPAQPAELGTVVEIPQVGGLHHRYEPVCRIAGDT